MMASARKRIAVYYPCFLGGGAEAVALWILEALQEHYEVTLFTIAESHFEHLNAMYGTHLTTDSVHVSALFSKQWRSLFNGLIANSKTLRMILFHALLRQFKAKARHYDLVISAYNAADLGTRGIQYIHWTNVLEGNAFHRTISNFSYQQLQENVSIANSETVALQAQKVYGVDSRIIYPPVVIRESTLDWEQKEDAFICSGRLVKAKEPHRVIQILQAVRQQGWNIKLHLTGGGGGAAEWRYRRFIRQLVHTHRDWVTLHENLTYTAYVKLLSRCKYGIHYKKEPFGIAIAEMVKAGVIPFVRTQGGQLEIVGKANTALQFDSEQDAAQKIIAVLRNPAQQQQLYAALATQRDQFSTERFMTEMNAAIQAFFESSVVTPPLFHPIEDGYINPEKGA